MSVDPDFFVDFHDRQDGPARAHEVRLQGGDVDVGGVPVIVAHHGGERWPPRAARSRALAAGGRSGLDQLRAAAQIGTRSRSWVAPPMTARAPA